MDISTVKPKSIEETATRPQGGSQAENGLSTFSASFKEFMKAGLSANKGGKSLIDTSEIMTTASRAATDPGREPVRKTYYEDAPERFDDSRDRLNESGRGERRDSDRIETRGPDRRDDFTRDQAALRGDAPSEGDSGLKAEARDEPQARGEQAGQREQDTQTPGKSEKTASNDATNTNPDQSGGKNPLEAAAAGDVLATSALKKLQETTAKKAPEDVLSAQIAVVQTAALSGRPSEQAKVKQAETGGRESALNGLAKALEASSNGSTAKAAVHQNGQNGQQSKADPNAQNQNRTDPQTTANATSKAAQQSTDLSRIVGAGNKVSVEVKTASAAETLISKPKATIVSNATQANEASTKPLRPGVAAQNGAANMGQNAAGAAQQATGGQARQAQAIQTPTAGNGSAPAANNASQAGIATQTAQAGGGEIPAPVTANATTETQQGKQTQAAKGQPQTHQANLPKQAVVDQVLVQINKAVSEGIDRINIQLKPGSLGRVDVQLELGKDGKISAVVIADKQDTLDLLQRDAKGLEQALKDAGMDLTEENLSFNLRGEENQDSGEDQSGLDGELAENNSEDGEETLSGQPLEAAYGGGIRPDGRIDIRA